MKISTNSKLADPLTFIGTWYDHKNGPAPLEGIIVSKESGAKGAQPPSIPLLIKMITCEISRIIINKIKDLFVPEPDEES